MRSGQARATGGAVGQIAVGGPSSAVSSVAAGGASARPGQSYRRRGWPGSRWWRQSQSSERAVARPELLAARLARYIAGGGARASASAVAPRQSYCLRRCVRPNSCGRDQTANRSELNLPEWGGVSGTDADGVGSPAGLGVSAERPAAASSSRINCRMEAAVSGSAAGTSGLSTSLISSGMQQ